MEKTTNVVSGYLCHCLRITTTDFDQILETTPGATFAELKQKHGVGSMCSSCEYEAKGVLQEFHLLHPEKRTPPRRDQMGLRGELRYAWAEIKKKFKPARPTTSRERAGTAAGKAYHTGVFFMRRDGLESHLAVSNIAFPEHPKNINGPCATFQATLYGEDGTKLATSRAIEVPDNQTLELSPTDLFPELAGDFVGGLYVEFDRLTQTGSLRPYGILVNTSAAPRARCHYHDKFALFRDPGFFQNTSPFERDQTCWMAVANCQPIEYATTASVSVNGRKLSTQITIGPMAARWLKLEDLFPAIAEIPSEQRSPALFWLDNPQHVMVYFFWLSAKSKTWMGQHH